LSIGSLSGSQKLVFHFITLAMNILLLIGGIVTLSYLLVGHTSLSSINEKLIWMFILFVALIITSLFNLLFVNIKIKLSEN